MKGKCATRFLGDVRPVKGYERYCVSKQGQVFTIGSTYQLKEISPCKTPKGYLKVWGFTKTESERCSMFIVW